MESTSTTKERAAKGLLYCCEHGWWEEALYCYKYAEGDPGETGEDETRKSAAKTMAAMTGLDEALVKMMLMSVMDESLDVEKTNPLNLAMTAHAFMKIPSPEDTVYEEGETEQQIANGEAMQAALRPTKWGPEADDPAYIGVVEELIEVLALDPRTDITVGKGGPLPWACANGKIVLTYKLLLAGHDASEGASAAIRSASANGHAAIVALLLQDGRAYPAVYDQAPLLNAAAHGHVDVVKLLLTCPYVVPSTYIIDQARDEGRTEIAALLTQAIAP